VAFRALYLEAAPDGQPPRADVRLLRDDDLDTSAGGSVIVDIGCSTLNYKDALAIRRGAPVVRRFPMVPGIDLAGTVRASGDPRWRPGDPVIANGWGLGERWWGGLAERAAVRADWLLRKPHAFSLHETMALGTAGYTAALCVLAIEAHGARPADGPVLVTGATGGVGSVAIMLLGAAGYEVAALTGKADASPYLQRLGASIIVPRAPRTAPAKPLERERWAAVVDSLGSDTLVSACASTRAGGIVAACGLAQGMDFSGTVAPFILRGVTLAGINSATAPVSKRLEAWQRLEQAIDRGTLRAITRDIPLDGAIAFAGDMLDGRNLGRTVVSIG